VSIGIGKPKSLEPGKLSVRSSVKPYHKAGASGWGNRGSLERELDQVREHELTTEDYLEVGQQPALI
jgi:hypothetical protein